ncbi:MAG: pre-peptidase C-terminal domain-containing protein, partial [Anaerolineales bacterium]
GVWTGLSLSAGDQITLTIVGTLDATFTGTLQNTAIVTPSGATDPNPNDNEDDDSNTSRHKADLALTKTSAPNPAIPGEAITYTLVVANAGPNAISAITLTDDLPDAIQSPNYTPSMGDYEETTGVWTGLSLSAGDQITLTIVGALDATFTGTLQNTAFVTPTDAIDPDPDNNEDDDSNPASPEVDLALSKTSAPRPAVPGAAITYTLVVTNAGPSTIFAITLTDDLPDEIQSPHYDPSVGSYDEATGAWTNLNFDAGDQITLTIVGTLDATFTGTLQNTAIVTPTNATERDPGDNEDDDSNPTRPEADLALSKTSAPNPAIPGEVITYTLVVANAGPSTAFALTLTDDLPDAIRGPAYTSSAGSYDETTGAWTGLSLGAGEIITLTIAGTLDATFTGTLQNTAIVTPTGVIDPNPDNNDAADNNPVSPQADLVLSKTASDATPDVGDEIAFTIVVTNAGPSAATGIEVMDQLPSGYTYVDAWASVGSYTVTTGWWMIGDLAVDATATLIVTATVNATGDYTNAAEVIEVDQDDPTSTPGDGEGDDYDETTPTPNLVADLGVDKRSAPRPYEIGGPITYTLVVTNAGPSAITALTLTDNLPAEILTPTYAASAGSYEPSTGAWIGFALNVGERVTLTITGVVDPNFIGVLQNTATVTTPQAIDPTPSNNESTDTNPASALLAATKHDVLVDDVDGNGFAGPGETLSYTVIISNIGASAATGVFFSDTLDVNTALITGSVRTSWGAVMMGNAPGDASVIVDLGVVAAGAVITIEFQARIDDPLPDDVTVLANQGWISSNELPDVPTDDPDTPEEGDPTETPIDLTCPVVADDYEPDDFYDLATDIATDGTVISRTFHIVADKDWARFYGWAGRAYTITTLNLSADVDTVVQLYVGDDATLLWENDDYRADSAASQIVWEATEDGWYYVRVTHFDRTYDPTASLICGNAYQLMVEMAPCGIDVDAYEPDDHFTAAVSRPVDGQPITRSFETLADKDWISFDAVAGRTYTITTSRLGGAVDTVLQLYDTDGKTLIDENDDYLAASDASQIVWTAARSGKYYVRITHFDPTYDPAEAPVCGNGYQVAVETALCDVAGDAYEPDDHFTAAAWRPAEGQPITRSFETLADKDWISFDAVAGRIYTITTSHLGGAVDTVLQLYDTDGKTLIDENDDYLSDSKASQIVWRAGKNGKYFVRITHFDPTYDPAEALVCGNDYRVAVATAICELSDPYEPDDHYVSAVAMPTSGELIQRRFVRVSDKDWFVFPVLAGEMYTITTSHLDVDVDTVIQLYDGDGRTLLLHNDDYMPESRASRIVWVAPRDGEVYVRVTHFDHTYDPRYSQVCGGGYALAVEQDTIGIDKWGEDVNGAPTLAGDIIEYTVVVWNKMNLSQTNVVLTDAIPMHTTYITNSARVNLGALSGPDPLVVRAPELDIGGRITLTFQVRMTRDARGQTILNYARVKSDQQIKETASPLAATQVLYQLFLPIITRSQ